MKPTADAFTPAEWRIVQRHRTPRQVQRFLNGLDYNPQHTVYGFREVVRRGRVQCLEAALTAAVILEQHGYPVRFLDLASQDELDHVLFLYQEDGRWGTVARSRDPGLHGRKPVFRSVRQLVNSYFDPYVDHSGRIVGYAVRTLEPLGRYDWRFSSSYLRRLERLFVEGPVRPFHGADRRYAFWHARYQAYKRRYPQKRPLYYPGRDTWLPGYPKGRA